jgi:hypothetical protein
MEQDDRRCIGRAADIANQDQAIGCDESLLGKFVHGICLPRRAAKIKSGSRMDVGAGLPDHHRAGRKPPFRTAPNPKELR